MESEISLVKILSSGVQELSLTFLYIQKAAFIHVLKIL